MSETSCGSTEYPSCRSMAVTVALLLAVAGIPAVQAQSLLSPGAAIAGHSQADLANQMAQWEFSYPAASNPLLDTTGAQAGLGDQGAYFFLAGSLSDSPVVRQVTVRNDQTLVFSPVGVLYWDDTGTLTEAGMRSDAVALLGVVTNLTVSVDGAPAVLPGGVASLYDYRQSTPLFSFTLAPDNIAGTAAGSFPALIEGYTMALQPLASGQHQLHFTVLMTSVAPFVGVSLAQDITYNITSVPEVGTLAMMVIGLAGIGGAARRLRG